MDERKILENAPHNKDTPGKRTEKKILSKKSASTQNTRIYSSQKPLLHKSQAYPMVGPDNYITVMDGLADAQEDLDRRAVR